MSPQFLFILLVNYEDIGYRFFFMQRIERRINLHLYALNILHSDGLCPSLSLPLTL